MADDYAAAFSSFAHNPMLEAATKIQGLQQNMLANQAAQQQFAARQALGPIMQSAVDPSTGEVDYNKMILGVASNPATAFMAPDFIDKAVARGLTQKEAIAKELDINMKQQNAIYDAVSGLLPQGSAIKQTDMLKAAADLYGAGVIDKNHYVNFATQLPKDGAPLYAYAKQLALRSQGAAKTLETVFQDIQARDQGGATVFTQNDRLGGEVKQVGVLPKTLTPEKNAEVVKFRDPKTLEEKQAPYGEVYGSGGRSAPGRQDGGGEPLPPGAPRHETLGAPAPGILNVREDFAKHYDDLTKSMESDRQLLQGFDKIEELVKGYKTGPGAEASRKVAETLRAFGADEKLVDKIANGNLAKGQELQSIFMALATSQMAKQLAGGGRFTNIEFNTFQASKPNENMDPRAVRDMIQNYKLGIKLEQKYAQMYGDAIESGMSPAEFNKRWADYQSAYYDYRKKLREKK